MHEPVLECLEEDQRHGDHQKKRQVAQGERAQAIAPDTPAPDDVRLRSRLASPHGAGSSWTPDPIRTRITSEIASRTTETAAAETGLSLWIWLKMKTDATSVLKAMFPEIRTSEPNSPIERAKASATPARIAGRRLGRMTRRKTVSGLRPQRGGGLLHLGVELEQHRLHRPDHERQGDEQERQHHADAGERHAGEAEDPVVAVEGDQRDARRRSSAARRAGR